MAKICISDGLITSTDEFSFCAGSNHFRMRNAAHSNSPTEIPHLSASSLVVAGDLTVHGSCSILNTTVCTTSAMSITNAGTGPALVVNQTGSQPVVNLLDDGSSVFYIEDGGNVGIGTTSPGGLLHLHSDGGNACGSYLLLKHANNNNTDIIGTIEFANNLGKTACIQAGTTGHCQSGYMSFSTELSGSASEVMRITEDSKVGIGITNPGHKLSVAGNAYISSTLCLGSYLTTNYGNNQGIYIGSGGANITSVTPSSKDIVIQDLNQLRFGDSSWDWNCWAGIKYDAANTDLIIGGPNSSAFTCNSNPPNIGVIFAGVDKVTINNCGGSDCNFVITRSGSTTAGLNLGVCADSSAIIASENSDLRLGKKCSGTFYEYSKICSSTGHSYINCDLFLPASVSKISLGPQSSGGDVHIGSSGLGSPTYGAQDYGAYIAHNAYRQTDGAWKHSRTSTICAALLEIAGGGSSGNAQGFYFSGASNAGTGNITWNQFAALGSGGLTVNCQTIQIKGATTSTGNLKFEAANPYICASSYIIMPGGLYVSGGTAYFSNGTKHRGGVGNDSQAWLCITGGTAGDTSFGGNVGIGTTDPIHALHVQSGSVFIGEAAYCSSPCCNSNGKLLNFDNSYDNTQTYAANKIRMHTATSWLGGFGICNGTVTYHSGGCHRWFTQSCPTSYGSVAMTLDNSCNLTVTGGLYSGGLVVSGAAVFGNSSIDPDSYTACAGGFGNIADGSGWGARGLFVHGGGAGDAAAIAHNGSCLFFGIQNGSAANSMATWLSVAPNCGKTIWGTTTICGTTNICNNHLYICNSCGLWVKGGYIALENTSANDSLYICNDGATGASRLNVGGTVYVEEGGNVGVGTTDFSYTQVDNTPLVGSKTNNKLFVNGSLQLMNNNDAIVIGRGTATFLKDEELGFGWGGGWYMTEGTYLCVRNGKTLCNTGNACFGGSLCVAGNTCLGNGSGDYTHINDILHVAATDSGDAHFYFGEGGTGATSYGAYWNWDSGYRHSWCSQNAGTLTMLMTYVTNNLDYLCMGRALHMGNRDIHYAKEVHFQCGARFHGINASGIALCGGSTAYLEMKPSNVTNGYFYSENNGNVGLLDAGGSWAIKHKNDSNTEFFTNNTVRASIGVESYFCGNVGIGTNDPVTSLHIKDSSSVIKLDRNNSSYGPAIQLGRCGSNIWTIKESYQGGNNRDLTFMDCNDYPKVTFQQSGDVGIGTSSPSAKLDVCGTGTVFSVNGTNGTLFSVEDDLSDSLMSVNDAAGLPVLEVFADSSVCAGRYSCSDFYIASGGNVGIGTTDPYSRFQVGDTEQTTQSELTIASRYDGGGPILNFRVGHPNNAYTWNAARICATDHGNYNGRLDFQTTVNNGYSGTQPTTRLRINASGDICATCDFCAYQYCGHSNIDGTGFAARFPCGFYASGTSWLYGSTWMNNNSILDLNEVDFVDQVKFCGTGNANELVLCGANASDIELILQTAGTPRGYLHANNGNNVGLLDAGGHWAIKHCNDNNTAFYDSNETLRASIGTVHSQFCTGLAVCFDWGGGNHLESLTIKGTYPSIALRSTNAGSNGGNVILLHSDGNGDLAYYLSPTGCGADSTSWTKRMCLTTGGALWVGSSISVNGNTVWHAGNDGGGSGLNADAVDGLHAASFLRADADDISYCKLSFRYDVSNIDSVGGSIGVTPFNGTFQATNRPSSGGNYTTGLEFTYYDQGARTQLAAASTGSNNTGELWVRSECWGTSAWTSWWKIWHSGNDGGGSGLDADLLDGQQGSYYSCANNLTGTYPDLFDAGTRYNIGLIDGSSSNTRDKIRVWTAAAYSIGMCYSWTYGALNNDYAMTFQMNNDNDRGFWWGDESHTSSQGAMSLTTHGYLTVANRIKVGGGESDTSGPSYPLHVVGDACVTGSITSGTNVGSHIISNFLVCADQGFVGGFGSFKDSSSPLFTKDSNDCLSLCVSHSTASGMNMVWFKSPTSGAIGYKAILASSDTNGGYMLFRDGNNNVCTRICANQASQFCCGICASTYYGDGSNLTGVGGGSETSCTYGSTSGTTSITLDVSNGTHVLPLASGAVVTGFTYNNRSSSGTVDTITLVIKYSGTASITWTNVVWSGGVTPTLTGTSGKADVFVLTSYNGSYWIGTIAATNLDSTNL